MTTAAYARRTLIAGAAVLIAPATAATSHADNRRLNQSVIANVYTVQHQAGCTNTQIGVWSENSLDRTVVVAVYGQAA